MVQRTHIVRMVGMFLMLAVLPVSALDWLQQESGKSRFSVDRWTVADGLPVNSINDLVFDEQGYLWLATGDGLVRFDGRHFEAFQRSNSDGLTTNQMQGVYAQADGGLWVLDGSGRLHGFAKKTFSAALTVDDEPLARVFGMRQTSEGDLVALTQHGLAWQGAEGRFRYVVAQGQTKAFSGLKKNEGYGLFVAANGCVYAGTGQGSMFQTCDGKTGSFVDVSNGAVVLTSFAESAQGRLLVGSNHGLYAKDGLRWALLPRTQGLHVFSVAWVEARKWLLATDAGMFVYDGVHDQLTRVEQTPARRPFGLKRASPHGAAWFNLGERMVEQDVTVYQSHCTINRFLFDRVGTAWVATDCDGLVRLSLKRITMLVDPQAPKITDGLAQAKDGAFYASSVNQVTRWSPSGDVHVFPLQNDTGYGHEGSGIHQGMKRPLLMSHEGGVLVGQKGICREQGGACVSLPNQPSSLREHQVYALFYDDQAQLWAAGLGHVWQQVDDGWHVFTEGLPSKTVQVIHQHSDGRMWFGTAESGVLRMTADGVFESFGAEHGLQGYGIEDFLEDDDGRLWVVTSSAGLCLSLNPTEATPAFDCINTSHGLHSNSLHRMIADAYGRFWLNSNSGLFSINQKDALAAFGAEGEPLRPRVYGKYEGLLNQEGRGGVQHAGIALNDGRLAFPTKAGVAVVDPSIPESQQTSPRMVMEQLELLNGQVHEVTDSMTLAQGARDFVLKYTGLSDSLTDQVYFQYRLLPDRKQWVNVGDQRSIAFAELNPGKHRLEMTAYNPASKAMSEVQTAEIVVPAHFWETWWFRLALLLLGALALAAWWRERNRQSKQREEELERRVQQRTKQLHEQTTETEQALQEVRAQRAHIEQLAAAKSAFFANVSHELRTPLTMILGPIKDVVDGREVPKQRFETMHRNGERLERLIQNMLDLERMDAESFPMKPREMSMHHAILEAVQMFDAAAAERRINMRYIPFGEHLTVHADGDQVQRVLVNLLSNAIKFTPEHGVIEIRLQCDDDVMTLRVEDSGRGVPEAWRTRIFNRFEQVSSDTIRPHEGVGLGLAMCQEIARLHRGTLHVEDSALGGACFVFALPMHAQADVQASMPAATANSTPSSPEMPNDEAPMQASELVDEEAEDARTPTILVVEDNPDLRQYIQDILSESFEVYTAADGALALDAARTIKPDLIVSDVMMPNLDGYGLVRALRQDPELAGVPLIFLTAKIDPQDEMHGLSIGADQYLKKPFERSLLLARIQAAMHSVRRLQRQLSDAKSSSASLVHVNDADVDHDEVFFAQVKTWVLDSLHENKLTSAMAAQTFDVSPSTFRRRFQSPNDESFSQFVRRMRLEQAKKLLDEGKGSVSEVAYAVGFGSLSGFSRRYKAHFGQTPSTNAFPATEGNTD